MRRGRQPPPQQLQLDAIAAAALVTAWADWLPLRSSMAQKVIDTHIHLAKDWQNGETGLPNGWLPSEGASFHRNWTEEDLLKLQSDKFAVEGFVFVECANLPAVSEAKWVLDMVADASSKVIALVANIPVPEGKEAVEAFLSELKDSSGKLPAALKGGRVVLLGDPMPPVDACLAKAYGEGLGALSEAGLLWEWCCKSESLPAIAKQCANFPDTTFVLDHIGHNSSGDDFETWAPALEAVAASNKNVFCKLGAVEQWDVTDVPRFMEHALKTFGPERCLAESNWFVNTAMGVGYDVTFNHVMDACKNIGYTQAQIDAVFYGNAKRCYTL